MLTNLVKAAVAYGTSATNHMIDYLPAEDRDKVRSVGLSFLKTVHEITGDMLHEGSSGEKPTKPSQTNITIE